MIGLLLASVVSAGPIGACADRAACRFRTGADADLKEALAGLELTAGELEAAPLKKAGGDLAFSLSAVRRGEEVVVKALSLQRPATIWGEAAVHVMQVPKPQWEKRAVISALKTAVLRALEDLRTRIDGVRTLRLSVRTSGLDGKARDHAERALLPCVKSLFELVGPVTSPELNGGYLDEAIEYLPAKEEPHQALQWQVARVREAILGGLRSKCTVWGSPLQGWSTFVAADEVNGAVVVSFKR